MFISSTEEGDKSGYHSWWFIAAGVGTVGSSFNDDCSLFIRRDKNRRSNKERRIKAAVPGATMD